MSEEIPRIAIFDDWWPLHMGAGTTTLEADIPEDWATLMSEPHFEQVWDNGGEQFFSIRDDRATREVYRLVQYRTCAICRQQMIQVSNIEDETLLLCIDCGYWGGRGFREWNSHNHATPLRGVIGRYKPIESLDMASTEYLVSHLRRFPKTMTKISPFRAEAFVADLLKDYLNCEVKPLGGRKDGGVDAYILSGDKIGTIVQIKWRESTHGAESVSVVREVAGTLLARGVPNGIIVSTRSKFSKSATDEAGIVSTRSEKDFGNIKLSLYDYHNILDMLAISNAKLDEKMKPEDLLEIHESHCVFDGAAMIPRKSIPSLR